MWWPTTITQKKRTFLIGPCAIRNLNAVKSPPQYTPRQIPRESSTISPTLCKMKNIVGNRSTIINIPSKSPISKTIPQFYKGLWVLFRTNPTVPRSSSWSTISTAARLKFGSSINGSAISISPLSICILMINSAWSYYIAETGKFLSILFRNRTIQYRYHQPQQIPLLHLQSILHDLGPFDWRVSWATRLAFNF